MLKPLFFTSIGYDQLISLQTSMNALQVPTTAVWTTATSTNTKGSFDYTCSPGPSDLPAPEALFNGRCKQRKIMHSLK